MSKDPAFLFYPSDFLTGCTDLTMEERGQYITLLCLQHQKEFLTEKTIRLSVGSVSVDVLKKFSIDLEGNYFNERLKIEIEKRLNFVDSRRINGQKGGRPTKASEQPNGKPNGLASENLPINRDVNINESLKGMPLLEIFFTDLPTSSHFENISRNLNIPKEKLTLKIPDFRKAAKVEYPNFNEFCNHFKNWVKKMPADQPTKKRNHIDI